jgi:hypothetical protein
MQENFAEFISKIENQLPELVTPDHLVKLGVAHHTALFRIRQKGALPFLKLSSGRILYLKSDVIAWLKQTYTEKKISLEECVSNDKS